MTDDLKRFEGQEIRSAWNAEEQQWYFSVVDVVAALTDSADPQAYWRKLKQRLKQEGNETVTNCHGLKMTAADGKQRMTDVADTEGIFRIIQSIPSKKAEPFKQWLAKVGAERIDETIDPELAIDRAFETYFKKGYSEEWIHQRLLSIRIRNDLTAEWRERGIEEGRDFAILTDDITRAWSGMSTRKYKEHKGLTKESLRDNMTDTELVLNMLAETSATNISKAEKPDGMDANRQVAKRGGKVAATAREALEAETGKPVVTSLNATDFAQLITGAILEVSSITDEAEEDEQKQG